ncbi:hypothetical protein [Methylobacterium tarhaniae]|nr:hypothetical protein [Methylobacterium tarhaniae]
MSRAILGEFAHIIRQALEEDHALVRSTGVQATPAGPRVLFEAGELPAPSKPGFAPKPRSALVAEAASRYLATRWAEGPLPRPVPLDSSAALGEAFPHVYANGTETPCGWHWLMFAGAEWLVEARLPQGFHTSQAKEKFACLRWYWHCDAVRDGQAAGIIRAVEAISAGICETCGGPGTLRRGGWVRTLCDEHAARR